MAWYRTRNIAVGTVDVEAQATSDGSRGTVGNFVVPDGAQSIREICVSVGNAARAVTACGGTMQLRLSGPGLLYGDQAFTVIGYSNLDTGNTADLFVARQVKLKVKIAVIPGMEISAFPCQSGVDWGTPDACIGLTFTSENVGKYIYVTRNGPAGAAVATAAAIGTLYNALTPGNLNLAGYKRITGFITVAGNNTPLATAAGGVIDVVLQGTCLGASSNIRLPCGAQSSLSTTIGNDGGYIYPIQIATDIPVQSGVLTINAYQNGVDVGSPEAAITLELEA